MSGLQVGNTPNTCPAVCLSTKYHPVVCLTILTYQVGTRMRCIQCTYVRQPHQAVTKNLDAPQIKQKNPDLNATRLKPKKKNK